VGVADERDIERTMRAGVRGARVAWLFGVLSLPEIAALLRAARLLIGNDSGLAHLAAACGTPVIALFGPQDPRRFAPWSARTRTLHHPVPCFPCDQTICVRPELPCVNLIEVAEVEAAARATLG
jgi:ADP-heptose:LPS heptosyltransferase